MQNQFDQPNIVMDLAQSMYKSNICTNPKNPTPEENRDVVLEILSDVRHNCVWFVICHSKCKLNFFLISITIRRLALLLHCYKRACIIQRSIRWRICTYSVTLAKPATIRMWVHNNCKCRISIRNNNVHWIVAITKYIGWRITVCFWCTVGISTTISN